MAPARMIRALDHFGIEVSDLRRAEAFYCGLLGLEVSRRIGGHQILLRCGTQTLALFEVKELPRVAPERIENPLGKGHYAFRVGAEDFQTARERFAGASVPTHGPVDWGDHHCLYFLDPDGTLLELVCYGD